MSREEGFSFTFVSKALPEDTFVVAEFKGTEGISTLYEFEILLYSDDPEIDLKAVLQNPATLTIIPEGDEERKIHGIPALFEQLHEYDEYVYYRLKLVPRYWLADQYHENMLFLDKSVPDIIEEVLKQSGLTSQDYELKLTGSYNPWEYICQYNETDYNFLSRWMEREGIYFFFDQSGEIDKLIITDSSTAHQQIEGDAVVYSPGGEATPSIFEQVSEFTCRQQILPKKVILKDYNYRKPSLDLKGEADVDTEGRGNVYIYGEHFKTPEEGNALAKIRAEELLCRESVYYGESTVSPFIPGYIFELEEHYRESYNQKYLLTEMTHQGVGADFIAEASGTTRITDLEAPSYSNRFDCILESVQFRPLRNSVKPRIDGTLNAKVDAAGDGQYAEIDDEGRYKVKLPFDQSDSGDGKASRWVRMAQPYAGADYGMHFPLHKGIEVLLTFVDGDPDRPIIAGSVPNPETMSPITGGNQTKSMIRTGGGNEMKIEDSDGGQLIKLSTPTEGTYFRMGASNPDGPVGVALNTAGEMFTHIGQHLTQQVDANVALTTSGDKRELIEGNTHTIHQGSKKDEMFGTAHERFVGLKTSYKFSNELELVAGAKEALFVGALLEVKAGGAITRAPWTHELKLSKKEKNATKDTQIGQLKEQIASLTEQVGTAQQRIGTMSLQIGTANQKIATLKQEVGSMIQNVSSKMINCKGNYFVGSGSIDLKSGGSELGLDGNAALKGGTVKINGTVKVNGTTLKVS